MTANLTLRTRVSHIAVRGLTGELIARTGSGGVTAERVKGDVDISTGSGGVDLREIEGQVVKLRAGSGTVEGDRVNADRFDANTGSGGWRCAHWARTRFVRARARAVCGSS